MILKVGELTWNLRILSKKATNPSPFLPFYVFFFFVILIGICAIYSESKLFLLMLQNNQRLKKRRWSNVYSYIHSQKLTKKRYHKTHLVPTFYFLHFALYHHKQRKITQGWLKKSEREILLTMKWASISFHSHS